MTVLAFERYPVDPSSTEAFEGLVNRLLRRAREAPGILWADAAKAFEDEPSYLVLSEWRTEADLDAWEATDDVGELRNDVELLLREDVTRRRLQG